MVKRSLFQGICNDVIKADDPPGSGFQHKDGMLKLQYLVTPPSIPFGVQNRCMLGCNRTDLIWILFYKLLNAMDMAVEPAIAFDKIARAEQRIEALEEEMEGNLMERIQDKVV